MTPTNTSTCRKPQNLFATNTFTTSPWQHRTETLRHRLCSRRVSSREQLERSRTCATSSCTSLLRTDDMLRLPEPLSLPKVTNSHRTIGQLKAFVLGPVTRVTEDGSERPAEGCSLAIRRIFNSVLELKVFRAKTLRTLFGQGYECLMVDVSGETLGTAWQKILLRVIPLIAGNSIQACQQLWTITAGATDDRVTTGVRFTPLVTSSSHHWKCWCLSLRKEIHYIFIITLKNNDALNHFFFALLKQ